MAEVVRTSFQKLAFSLAAGEVLGLPLDADQVLVTTLSGADAIQLRVNDGPKGEAFRGLELRGELRHVEFTNDSAGTVTLELLSAVGLALTDRRLNLVGGQIETDAASPVTLRTTADATVAATSSSQVLAADTDRAEAILKNLDGSNSVRVGDSNVGAARGHELGPGDSIVLTTSDAVHVHNPNGAAVDVSLVETVRS